MKAILLTAILLAAVPAMAAAAPVPAWAVDKASSRLGFTSSFSGEAFSGAFRRWDADIRFDPKNLAGSSVTATIDTASAATGDADRDKSLPGDPFFAAAKFPKAAFAARSFQDLGGGRYQAVGVLTIRGVSKPLTLPFTLAITGAAAKMNASIAINRLAFGVGQGEWKAVEAIPAAVTVTIAINARRTP